MLCTRTRVCATLGFKCRGSGALTSSVCCIFWSFPQQALSHTRTHTHTRTNVFSAVHAVILLFCLYTWWPKKQATCQIKKIVVNSIKAC